MFFALKFFLEEGHKIWHGDYKIEHTSDDGAKFRNDQPIELGNLARKKRK